MDDKKTNNKCVILHQRCARLNTLDIFSKYINNNNKLIPFKIKNSYKGNIKYLPPVSKE